MSAIVGDLTSGLDARGDYAYFIEGYHFSDDEWSVDDQAHTRRPARTLPMNIVFEWAEKQTDKYRVTSVDTIYEINKT